MGAFDRIFAALSGEGGLPDKFTIDATRLKAHRTAASLLKKEGAPDRANERPPERETACWH
tara:strand:+ start:12746 stop:12928 length:183 start_codon:yes stop_codon:yes gene_type:complete